MGPSMAGEDIEITVHCEEASHAGKRWEIARFKQISAGHWLPSDLRFKSELRYVAGEIKTMVWIEGERRYLPLGEAFPDGLPKRVRPRLRCKLCGLAFIRKDTALLDDVLDKLAAAGMTDISLRSLIAITDSIAT